MSGMSLWQRRSFRELLPSLAEHRVLVKVPIYSGRDAAHDWVTRSPGSLADSLRLIEWLQRGGVRVLVSYLVLPATCDDVAETCEFLRKLVGDRFVISTVVYPSRRSASGAERGLSLLDASTLRTLLDDGQFSAVPMDYVSFQAQCQSGCRFPVVAMSGDIHGCTVNAASGCGNVARDRAALKRAGSWRPADGAAARMPPCDACFAAPLCKRCPCFMDSGKPAPVYCQLVRACAEVVFGRVRRAIADGMGFLHEDAKRRWEACEVSASLAPTVSRR